MSSNSSGLLAGDLVEVKDLAEITKTLDEDGTLGGLPFMPEMAAYCGCQFRVERKAGKACIEARPGDYEVREFSQDNLVVLEGLRCSGEAHDNCQRLCLLFWSSNWLRKINSKTPSNGGHSAATSHGLPPNLKTRVAPNRYFCQSTQLIRITVPLTKKRILGNCIDDVRSGSRRFSEMLALVLFPAWRKLTDRIPRRKLLGTLTRTPVGRLDLQPGESVGIRTASEIAGTLDTKGRTRGLSCDLGMANFRGPEYKVAGRLDRMISEPTGEMRKVESTVILEGLECTCMNVVGGCPRREPIYWREVWLERSNSAEQNT